MIRDFFLQNKYHRWYDALVLMAQMRMCPDGYNERHHILPRCLGGENNKENLVRLTFREHFLAHWLLTKFTEGKARISMLRALNKMQRVHVGRIVAGWQYAVARVAAREAQKNTEFSILTRQRMKESAQRRAKSDEGRKHFEKLQELSIGRKASEQTLIKMQKSRQAFFETDAGRQHIEMLRSRKGIKRSEEACQRFSIAQKKRFEDPEQCARQSLLRKGKKASEETKKNTSESAKRRFQTEEGKRHQQLMTKNARGKNPGHPHSEDTKAFLSAMTRARPRCPKTGRLLPKNK